MLKEKVYNVKMYTANRVFNFKENNNYITCIDNNNNVYICKKENYKDKVMLEGYLVATNNTHIWHLLSTSYCQLALNNIFTKKNIKLYNRIKKEFNICIPVNTDKDYITFVEHNLKIQGII